MHFHILSGGGFGYHLIQAHFGVKDSSKLLPGHGGLWDRLVSLLWAVPIGYNVIGFCFPDGVSLRNTMVKK
jgi:phosphatidate cytidylyltransferase